MVNFANSEGRTGGTGIRGEEAEVEGAEAGVEWAEAGVEGAEAGVEGEG